MSVGREEPELRDRTLQVLKGWRHEEESARETEKEWLARYELWGIAGECGIWEAKWTSRFKKEGVNNCEKAFEVGHVSFLGVKNESRDSCWILELWANFSGFGDWRTHLLEERFAHCCSESVRTYFIWVSDELGGRQEIWTRQFVVLVTAPWYLLHTVLFE